MVSASTQPASYFIADLHLTGKSRDTIEAFCAFCQSLSSRSGSRLIVLGDLFHYWITAEDFIRRNHEQALQCLRFLCQQGVEVHYFVGNRDFLFRSMKNLPQQFHIYQKPAVLTLGKRRYYLTHGDDLCRADWGYRLTTPFLRAYWVEMLFNLFPSPLQHLIAGGLSRTSKQVIKHKNPSALGVSREYCTRLVRQYELDGIIHGHIHENKMDTLSINQRCITLLSVGPWEKESRPVWRLNEDTGDWSEIELVSL